MTTLGAVFRPQFPPERLAEVVQAADAAGLAELRLSGELADGTILTAGTDPEQVRQARARVSRLRAVRSPAGPAAVAGAG